MIVSSAKGLDDASRRADPLLHEVHQLSINQPRLQWGEAIGHPLGRVDGARFGREDAAVRLIRCFPA